MSEDGRVWGQKEDRLLGWFILASGLILFVNLWARSLENHGYLRYAEIAREMIRSGEWVVPHLNGGIFIDKPPLLFWLIAIPSFLYGSVTPFIARLPIFVSAWAGVIVVTCWARRVYGTLGSGLVAGSFLVASYQYFFQARLAKTDLLLCCLILLSLYFFYVGYGETRWKRALFQGLSFLSMGLSTLTKGPFGCVLPFLVIVAFLAKEKKIKMLFSKEFLLGYLVFGLTVLPWAFLFIGRVGWDETIALVKANRILSRRGPFYFYLQHIWGEFFPASLFLPLVFVDLWKRRKEEFHSGTSFFLIWFLGILLLLTFFKFKATRYLLPALPPLALMVGGIAKKNLRLFLLPCLLCVMAWHFTEIHWIRGDRAHSPGMVLVEELRPYLQAPALYGYRLDDSTVEEVNFYLDRVIPQLKKIVPSPRGGVILMPKRAYEETRARLPEGWKVLREFDHKEEKLVLASFPGDSS